MPSEPPKADQKVTVEHTDSDGDRTIFEGMVAEVEADRFAVALARPEESDGVVEKGDEVRVRYSDSRGLCFFLSRVLELGGPGRLWLEAPAAPQRVQRRRFLRLPIQVPISCIRITDKGESGEVCRATTLELGGNGAGMTSEKPFVVGERVRFKLDLGGKWGLCAGMGQVKRSVLAPLAEGGVHRVALQFIEIDSKSQARILSYLLTARRGEEDL